MTVFRQTHSFTSKQHYNSSFVLLLSISLILFNSFYCPEATWPESSSEVICQKQLSSELYSRLNGLNYKVQIIGCDHLSSERHI